MQRAFFVGSSLALVLSVAWPACAQDSDLFRRLVLAEAGGEGELGMALVARSVLNRSALIQSGATGAGTYLARGGGVDDVIRGRNQYQPLSDGSIHRRRSAGQLASAQRAIDLAYDTNALRSRLQAQGLSNAEVDRLVNATGFRTGDAFNDPSQNYARQRFGNHVFNGDRVSTRQDVGGAFDEQYGGRRSGQGAPGGDDGEQASEDGEATDGQAAGGAAQGVEALRKSLGAAEGLLASGRSDFADDALSIGQAVVKAIQEMVAKAIAAQQKAAANPTDPAALAAAKQVIELALQAIPLMPQAQSVLARAYAMQLGSTEGGLAAALGDVLKAAAGAQGSTPQNGQPFVLGGQAFGWGNQGGQSSPVALGQSASSVLGNLFGGGAAGQAAAGALSGLLQGGSPGQAVAGALNGLLGGAGNGAGAGSGGASALASLPAGASTTVRAGTQPGSGWVNASSVPGRAGSLASGALPTTTARGNALAGAAASAAQAGTVGWCYRAVATAVGRVVPGVSLSGESAYMAADQLARSPAFREVSVAAEDLPALPAGAIVVWGKTSASPHGHISIADGNGNELSDHKEQQRTQLRGYTNARVFVPR